MNWQFCLLTRLSLHHDRLVHHWHQSRCCSNLSVNLLLHSNPLMNKTQIYLKPLHRRTHSESRVASPAFFQLRIMTSALVLNGCFTHDCKMLPLTAGGLHSIKPQGPCSSHKDKIQSLTNTTGNDSPHVAENKCYEQNLWEGNPGGPIRNEFDLQPPMKNKFSLKLHRDRMTDSTGSKIRRAETDFFLICFTVHKQWCGANNSYL